MQEHRREEAGYCAMRALSLGMSLPHVTPVVGRAYASLCLVESAAEKASGTKIRRYKRKAEQFGELAQLSYTLLAAGVIDAGQVCHLTISHRISHHLSPHLTTSHHNSPSLTASPLR